MSSAKFIRASIGLTALQNTAGILQQIRFADLIVLLVLFFMQNNLCVCIADISSRHSVYTGLLTDRMLY